MEFQKRKAYPNPWTSANLLSRLFYWWVTPLVWKGKDGNLKSTDIYDCPSADNSEKNGARLKEEWEKEILKQKDGKSPSLLKAAVRSFGLICCLNAIYTLVEELILHIMQPIFLGYLVQHFAKLNVMSKNELYIYTFLFCILSARNTFTNHQYFFGAFRIGMRVRVACCALVYKKALRLSQSALGRTTIGQMVNLLSNDVNRFDQCVIFLPYLVVGPLQIAIVTVILWSHIGYASLTGVVALLLFIPFQGFMGSLFSKLRIKTAILTDERIRLMNEIIGGMRVIKMYGWEFPFAKLVDSIRRKEIKKIRISSYLRGLNLAAFFTSSKIILLVSFVVFVLGVKGDLTPEKVFVSMALFNNLIVSMTLFFPYAISQGAESLVSFKRIQDFLLLEEKEDTALLDASNLRPKLSQCGVWMQKVVASWNKDGESTLRNITLSVTPGELLVVVGPVGCGKTSLLNTLLGELPIVSGEVKVRGKVAYAAQEAWIFGGSVKQNVLFGSAYDENKYKKVLEVCALDKDIELFPHGDETAVGERGVSLSGGQKARVNLARAMYFDADIFLLDDPLSAVDTSVSKHLFEKCINDYLKDKVRILATHQIQFLKAASRILVLKEGQCFAFGSYNQLVEMGVDLGSMMEDCEQDRRQRLTSTTSSISSIGDDILEITSPIPIYESNASLASSPPNDLNNGDVAVKDSNAPQGSEELKTSGTVKFKIYSEYIKSGAGLSFQIIIILLFITGQVIYNGSDFWLTAWTNGELQKYNVKSCWKSVTKTALNATDVFNNSFGLFDQEYFKMNIANVSDDCFELTSNYSEDEEDIAEKVNMPFHLSVYSVLVLVSFILALIRSTAFFQMCMKASVNLHNKMFKCILRSPVAFFDNNPVGRVLNRFSKDTGIIDEMLPMAALDMIITFGIILGVLFVVAIVEPWLLLPTAIIGIFFVVIRRYYIPTARDVKRYEGINKSPIFSHLSTSLYGLTTIRAFKMQQSFEENFDYYQDQHSAAWFLFIAIARWLGVALDWLSLVYITCVTVTMVLLSEDPSYASKAGLAITTALQMTGNFQWAIRQAADVESQMTSVERVIDYSNLEPESSLESDKTKKPPKDWPSKGYVIYNNVSLRYVPNEPSVLKNLSFEIYPEEKIGIVGRTGAGKSSMIATLFRMTEPEGEVMIDGIATKDIGLHDLRRKISIIPQDPVLFTGPVRRNLDPFNEHKDDELWLALDEAYLKESIEDMPGGLDSVVAEGGSNFSVGQRQLICLARAILRRNKILVLDEATANVDPNTDSLIQKTIRERFADCTVLTIAHRLHTIMDSDRVLVLDAGEVKEFDKPHTLLQTRTGLFSHMVQQTGQGMASQLREIARIAFFKRENTKKDVGITVFGGHGGGDIIEMNGISHAFNHVRNGSVVNSDQISSNTYENTEKTYL